MFQIAHLRGQIAVPGHHHGAKPHEIAQDQRLLRRDEAEHKLRGRRGEFKRIDQAHGLIAAHGHQCALVRAHGARIGIAHRKIRAHQIVILLEIAVHRHAAARAAQRARAVDYRKAVIAQVGGIDQNRRSIGKQRNIARVRPIAALRDGAGHAAHAGQKEAAVLHGGAAQPRRRTDLIARGAHEFHAQYPPRYRSGGTIVFAQQRRTQRGDGAIAREIAQPEIIHAGYVRRHAPTGGIEEIIAPDPRDQHIVQPVGGRRFAREINLAAREPLGDARKIRQRAYIAQPTGERARRTALRHAQPIQRVQNQLQRRQAPRGRFFHQHTGGGDIRKDQRGRRALAAQKIIIAAV